MKVAQIATILNNVMIAEQIGDSVVVNEDLTNIVEVGQALYDGTSGYNLNDNFDNFIGKMIDQIGRITFVDRVYKSQAPKILVDSWEYGSILMKVRAEIPDAANNATWTLAGQSIEATTGASITAPTTVDPFVITKPDVNAKFFNSKTTFEIPITIAEIQLKEAFRSAGEMNRFISMIQNRISLKATLSSDAMVMRTINNLIAQKLGSGNNVVNLLTEYKTATGNNTITVATALSDPDFLRYASKTIMMYKKFINNASLLYNEDGYVTFTPDDRLRAVMLSDFSKALEVYLYSDTYHNEFVTLEGYTEVPYWQGAGSATSVNSIESGFTERSTINVKTLLDGTSTAVSQSGVIGVLFDEEAAVVCNDNQRVTSIWNPKGEYWNYFYKYDCSYLNDTAENCIVFIIANPSAGGQ